MQPYVPRVDLTTQWIPLTIPSDVDADPDTVEKTSVLLIGGYGVMVRVTTVGAEQRTESMAAAAGIGVMRLIGKTTKVFFGHVLSAKAAPGSITESLISETPEFLEAFQRDAADFARAYAARGDANPTDKGFATAVAKHSGFPYDDPHTEPDAGSGEVLTIKE